MLTLNNANVGESLFVKKINGPASIRRRIMDMGITKDTKLKVIKFAPLGDPVEIEVRGYQLSIRKDDAKNIEVIKEELWK